MTSLMHCLPFLTKNKSGSPSPANTGLKLSLLVALLVGGMPLVSRAVDGQGPLVTVVAARGTALKQTISVVGTIVPKETTLVNSDLGETRIVSVDAEEGDLVAAGQVLAALDTSRFEVELLQNDAQKSSSSAQLGQASSALENAVITCQEAEADLQRAEKLVPKGLLSQEILEQRQRARARAEVSINAAEQSIKAAQAQAETVAAARKDIELRLRYTRIVAPVAGRITKRSAKVGGVPSSGGEQLFVIADDDQFELEAEIPQSKFGLIAAGATADISFDNRAPDLKGFVRFVGPTLADSTRLGRARISLPSGSLFMPVGAFASAEIQLGRRPGIFLPSTAISNADGESSIKILKDNRIERKPVTTGIRQDGLVQVLTGIDEGDLVVLRSGGFMDVGDEARPVIEQANASTEFGRQ